ncbi:MAG TPA: N-acetylmuramoyl-L-alanine amidase [Anaerovoracaceae bacterium]|nr:N-acetylmuramoyl-L-alanine amidase [Anaerovoracaceae bacterium]
MPSVYLSPSTQEFNHFINGGDEEYYMNLIVDAMVPYLRASGIEFARNNPGDSVSKIIERSNETSYDLHLALQSRGTPDGNDAPLRGIDVYYYAVSSISGEKAAYIIYENLKTIYPVPELVSFIPNLTMLELSLTNAPAVLVELGYYDNIKDALWIENNIEEIGRNLALSVAEFLHVPFKEPQQQMLTPMHQHSSYGIK